MNRLQLPLLIAIAAILPASFAPSAQAELEATEASKVVRLRDRYRPVTTVKEWQKQLITQSALVQVTSVKLNRVDTELEIVLETQDGQSLQIDATKFTSEGNSLIATIPNTTLALTNAQEFSADNPTENITNVRVTQLDASTIRVSVTGKDALPTEEVTLRTGDLSYSLNPEGEAPDEEIVVTGDRTPYRAPSSGTATGTNIPILETPFSIQIIPKDVLRDQQATRLEESLLNVSGVSIQGNASSRAANFSLRGFDNAPVLRDGFRRYGSFQASPEIANLEQIEVLKGAASILYGEIQPGGVINLVSKKPLSKQFFEAELELGSRNLFSPRFDVSGPLTTDGNLLYRVNALVFNQEPFQGFDTNFQRAFIAPTIAWKISDRTDLNVSLEYLNKKSPADFGIPASDRGVVDIPRDRVTTDPSDWINSQFLSVGYNFEHRFSQDWKIRNAFRYSSYDYDFSTVLLPFGSFDASTGILERVFGFQEGQNDNFSLLTNVLGEFTTGSVKHTLLFGVDLNRSSDRIFSSGDFLNFLPLDVFNPVYGQPPKPSVGNLPPLGGNLITTNRLGIYVQDQISLFDRLKLLAGIRYDTVKQTNERIPGLFTEPGETTQTDDALTPRVGLLYQLSKTVSLYGSYSQSFNPGSATTSSGEVIEAERGEGYEFGIKTELLNGKLLATAAYFDITKQNVAVTDPNFPLFSVASGEQRSRGVEFDIAGEILPGWNLIASYTYTNAEVTKDSNSDLIGNRLFGVPKHSASLWTTYEIPRGDLQGLGIGFGFNFVGERQGDLANSYEVDSYFITNAAIFYRRGNWRFAMNFKNLGNVKYIESTSNGNESGNFFGELFTVIGSVSVTF